MSVRPGDSRCPEEYWNSKLPSWIEDLRQFGEIGVMRKSGIMSKLENKGVDRIMVGYASNSGKGVY